MDLYAWFESTALSTWVRETPTLWGFAMIITLHTFGMAVLVGVSAVLNLRLLGVGRGVPLGPLQGLFRVMWVAFILNLVTGTILFLADATRHGVSLLFGAKMLLVIIGVTLLLRIQRLLYGGGVDAALSAPTTVSGRVRSLAALSLAIWVITITAGRLLAYL